MLKYEFRRIIASLVAILMVSLMVPSSHALDNSVSLLNEIERISTDHFLSSSSVMLDAANQPLHYSEKDHIYNDGFLKAVSRYRQQLAEAGEEYESVRSEAKVESKSLHNDGTIHVVVKETTYLTIKGMGTDTGYSTKHELIFQQGTDGNLVLDKDIFLEPTGLLPLHEAEKYVNSTSAYYGTVDDDLVINDVIRSAETVRPSNRFAHPFSLKAGYNYAAMASYLERYWSNYNPDYRRFDNDCTNFVSQALRAGGWQDKTGWYGNANYWWYNSLNQSRSWINVDYWGTFARNSGRTSMLSNVWYLQRGDVLQVTNPGSGQKVHTMMVSYVNNGVPYFTYHTSNRYRRSMNQVLLDWKDATYYAYRT